MPRDPFCQMAANAAKHRRMEMPARASAPKKVASAGRKSRKPKRTTSTDTKVATREKIAIRRAQEARAEIGSF